MLSYPWIFFSVYVAKLDALTGEIVSSGTPVTVISGNKDYDWNVERLTIAAEAPYKLAFEVFKGFHYLFV